MLFNSYEFLFFFLPFVFTIYRLLVRSNISLDVLLVFLCTASFGFYAWWQPTYLLLLGGSILGNYGIARLIASTRHNTSRTIILTIGIILNLSLLAYYKYTTFILENLQSIGYWQGTIPNIVLPLAISFFTFQQIAYLVTCFKNPASICSLLEHVFFITFFPHLIAGPIVYKNELIDQVRAGKLTTSNLTNWQQGLSLFVIGLAKKMVIGDNLAELINPLYDTGGPEGSFDAWIGSFIFGFQIYFDFSAYSDMALGLAYLFGLRLPINFDSPYKASSYREFWRRWHITLFRFFRDHIYTPMKGTGNNPFWKIPLSFLIFFLSGLWHGAAWTFVAWGVANWLLIQVNDAWIFFWKKITRGKNFAINPIIGRLYVFIAMSLTFMLFRSPDFGTAKRFIDHLFSPLSMEKSQIIQIVHECDLWRILGGSRYAAGITVISIVLFLLMFVWHLPNAVRFAMPEEHRSVGSHIRFNTRTAILLGFTAWLCLMSLPKSTEFLYFQF